jgi:hypothetical protein
MKSLLGFVLVTVYDTILTLVGLGRGHEEGNALIVKMMGIFGEAGGLIIMKLLVIVVAYIGLRVLHRYPILVRTLLVSVCTFIGASMWWSKL